VLVLPVAQKLSKEQTAVLNAVLSGKNVFFTGSAGNELMNVVMYLIILLLLTATDEYNLFMALF